MNARPLIISALLIGCGDKGDDTADTAASCTEIDAGDLGGGGTLEAGCYLLNADLDVTGAVILEDGVQVFVADEVWIDLRSSGSLTAQGSAQGILLEGQGGEASWRGLQVEGALALEGLTIRGACSGDYGGENAALHLITGGSLTGQGLTIEGCPDTGIYDHDSGATLDLVDLTVTGAASPAFLSLQQATGLSGTLLLDNPPVLIGRGALDEAGTLPPLMFQTTSYDVSLSADLTLSPGAELRMHADVEFNVTDSGRLYALGTEEEPVVIRGVEATPGYWRGVTIRSAEGLVSQLEHTEISDAGSHTASPDYTSGGLYLDDAEAELSHVTLSNHAGFALSVIVERPSTAFVSDSVIRDSERSVALSASSAGVFDATNVMEDNGEMSVVIAERYPQVDQDSAWTVTSVPYVVRPQVDVEGALTVPAGVTMQFEQDAGLDVVSTGLLSVGSIEGAPVILEGVRAQAGLWKGVQLDDNTDDNRLENVEMRDAGGGWNNAERSESSVYLEDSRIDLIAVRVLDSGAHDIYGYGASVVTCRDLEATIEGSEEASLCEP